VRKLYSDSECVTLSKKQADSRKIKTVKSQKL